MNNPRRKVNSVAELNDAIDRRENVWVPDDVAAQWIDLMVLGRPPAYTKPANSRLVMLPPCYKGSF